MTLSWTAPFDSGGDTIGSYQVNVTRSDDNVNVGTYTTNDMMTSANNLDPLTRYSATVEAISKDGLVGNASDPVVFTTVEASIPGKPTDLEIPKATGGALYMRMNDPLDVGGSPILTYTLLMTSAQYPTIFRQVYEGPSPWFNATHLTVSTAYRLQYKVANNVVRLSLILLFTSV